MEPNGVAGSSVFARKRFFFQKFNDAEPLYACAVA